VKHSPRLIVPCPDSEMDRLECPCAKCAEHRGVLHEKIRDEAFEAEWKRRFDSRKADRDEACRINGRINRGGVY
jgi:hypothetical protein